MFLLIPYQVDVPMSRWPIANWAIIGLCTVLSVRLLGMPDSQVAGNVVIFQPDNILTWIGCAFFHAGILHLLGNMVFLFVFGNAINHKLGQAGYVAAFLLLALLASFLHMLADGRPCVGASGAICGLAGMFLVYFPRNDVSCFWLFLVRFGWFSCSSFIILALYLVWDVIGAIGGHGQVAYAAHVGGWIGGMLLAWVLLKAGLVRMTPGEQALFSMGREAQARVRPESHRRYRVR